VHADVLTADTLTQPDEVFGISILVVLDRQCHSMRFGERAGGFEARACRCPNLLPAGQPHRAPVTFQDAAQRQSKGASPQGARQGDERLQRSVRGNPAREHQSDACLGSSLAQPGRLGRRRVGGERRLDDTQSIPGGEIDHAVESTGAGQIECGRDLRTAERLKTEGTDPCPHHGLPATLMF